MSGGQEGEYSKIRQETVLAARPNSILLRQALSQTPNPQFGQTGKLRGPIAGLQNSFWMSYTSASGSPCEYTMCRSRKKDKKRKNDAQKSSKLTKTAKNPPKSEKEHRENRQNPTAAEM
jgi:hypothetical protein